MSQDKQVRRISRRSFLRGAGLSAGAAAAVAVIGAGERAQAASSRPKRRTAGYRETEHVRRVYELSRF